MGGLHRVGFLPSMHPYYESNTQMYSRIWPLLALGALLGACTGTPVAVPDAIVDVAAYDVTAPVAIRDPVVDLRQSEPVGAYVLGWHCTSWPRPVRYFSIRREVARADFGDVLAQTLRDAGMRLTNDPTDLFSAERSIDDPLAGETTILDIAAWRAEDQADDREPPGDGRRFEIGARITALDIAFCPEIDPWSGARLGHSGDMTLTVDWQVFDHHRDEVVLRQQHDGGATLDLPDPQNVALLAEAAFLVAAQRFLADQRSRALLTGGQVD